MQDADDIKPGYPLFNEDQYQQAFARKNVFEEREPKEKLEEVFRWTTTEEYKQLNFKREALTINPAKACQPLGAVLCALVTTRPRPTFTVRRVAWLFSYLF